MVVQSLRCVRLFANPWTAARQAPLSPSISQSLLKFMSIGLVVPSCYLFLCCLLLLLPSIFPNIRVFSSESALWIRWPKYRSFSFSQLVQLVNIQNWTLGVTGLISLSIKSILISIFIPSTNTLTETSRIVLDQIAGYPVGSVKATHKINHYEYFLQL